MESETRHTPGSSFLSSRVQQVIVDGAASEKAPVISGVPQGTELDSLLFLLFTNDLPDSITFQTSIFADDCFVYIQIKTQEDSNQLQLDPESLHSGRKHVACHSTRKVQHVEVN